ncbi:MAG TPA: hypothetical protein VG166_01745 [Caulobacteraceae bacterium]|jgi:hypothetical protein|nr:hypothetical protein [Caulobacteraceae bacterium]
MTTKYIDGAVTGGYTLSAAYTGVLVGASGTVTGSIPIFAGGDGGTGLTLPFAASLTNKGRITGGAGQQAGPFGKFYLPAGVGGAGVDAAPGSTVTNSRIIYGGAGGVGDDRYGGGAGGTGLHVGAGSTVSDSGRIHGGQGGAAAGTSTLGGGAGGVGLDLAGGRIVIDGGSIYGGLAGWGGSGSGAGGAGGAGVILEAVGIAVMTTGLVFGGTGAQAQGGEGGAGGAGVVLAGGGGLRTSGLIVGGDGGGGSVTAGVGGAGVEALAKSTIVAEGTIEGGAGGGGGGSPSNDRSQGGAGVLLAAGGLLTHSQGLIMGGYGCYGNNATGLGGGGGAGILLQSGGKVVNAASISGGQGSPNSVSAYSGGFGVWLLAGGTVNNTGAITGGAAERGGGSYLSVGIELSAGGRVVNGAPGESAALISGGNGVVALSAGAVTVINYGTISGRQTSTTNDDSVLFMSARDRLVVEPGATFIGDVSGGGGTLELASGKGTISGLGVTGTVSGAAALTFIGFDAYDIDKGTSWSLGGAATLAAGQTMIDAGTLNGSGTLGLTGGAVTFEAGARLATARVTLAGASSVTDAVSLAYAGQWIQSAGTLSVAAGQTATFTGVADSFSGALAGVGTVVFAGGSDSLEAITLKVAKVDFFSGATVALSGAVTNDSAVGLRGGKLIVAAAGVTLSGTGAVSLSDSAANRIIGATAASRLLVRQVLQGAGDVGGGAMVLVNGAAGTIRSEGANALILDTGAASITNAGMIESVGAGGLAVVSAIANTGRLYAQASTLTIEGAVSGTGYGLVLNGTLKATAAATFNQNVTFAVGATGALELAHGQTYKGRITGFSKTGATRLDLDDIAFAAGTTRATFSGTTASGVLTVTDGTHTARITLTGDYTSSTFTVSSDGHGGTNIVDPPAASAARLAAAASSFGAMASGPMQPGAEPRHTQPGHLLSVARGTL